MNAIDNALIPSGRIEGRILLLRGHKVMLDADLAELYGVSTKRFNEQVKRNRERFPVDFLFQFTAAEKAEVVANCDHLQKLKFSKSLPYAFTEHGAIQAANVLASAHRLRPPQGKTEEVRPKEQARSASGIVVAISGISEVREHRCSNQECSLTPFR